MTNESQYSDATLASIQELFGEGFLSPGGVAEVRDMVEGIDLRELQVLDLGCGLGGGTIALARDLGAGHVLGIDIEAGSLERAKNAVRASGLEDRIDFKLVEPGPIPLAEANFDVVFSKEAICHVVDKEALFAEVFRVLRPGGSVAVSDWMTGREGPLSQAYVDWADHLRQVGLFFSFATPQAHADALSAVGFTEVEARDRSEDTTRGARHNIEHIMGEGRERLRAALGGQGYDDFLDRAHARLAALEGGDLVRCHLRACKPL